MILNFDFASAVPLYIQLRNQIVMGIAEGKLHPGEQLPPIRVLADEAEINMMTVSKGYQLLKQEGYITTDRRHGAKVCGKEAGASLSKETLQALKVHLCECKLAGLSEQETLALCRKLCEEGAAE